MLVWPHCVRGALGCVRMFLAADLNDDGTISYDEFVRWYSSTPHSTAETLEAGYSHLGNMHCASLVLRERVCEASDLSPYAGVLGMQR